MARIIWGGETAYIRTTGDQVAIITVDHHVIPHRYSVRYEDGSYADCHRSDLQLRKPKKEVNG